MHWYIFLKVPGEVSSPTQPFPKDAFLRTARTFVDMRNCKDLWGYTHKDRKYCQDVKMNNVSFEGSVSKKITWNKEIKICQA